MSGAEEGAYAVIFTARRASGAEDGGYADAAERMAALAEGMPGYLGHDSVRGADGLGITVSYWRALADIARWRAHPDHASVIAAARERGWYVGYESVTARIERVARR